jgi:hypothetical protein
VVLPLKVYICLWKSSTFKKTIKEKKIFKFDPQNPSASFPSDRGLPFNMSQLTRKLLRTKFLEFVAATSASLLSDPLLSVDPGFALDISSFPKILSWLVFYEEH